MDLCAGKVKGVKSLSRITLGKEEQIFLLVVACLMLLGGGFQLLYRHGELLLEVDPVTWAEANQRDGNVEQVAGDPGSTLSVPGEPPSVANEPPSSMPSDLPVGGTTESKGASSKGEKVLTVNINTASAQELTALPGVGPVLAGRIVDYRHEHGPFLDGQQLIEIKGIGSKTLARMLPFVIVRDDEEALAK
ncbi:MAG: helix-hairpin-helix domain-containing protein [Firmicutes bacterium]|nr:helix-hairpin-helix domain-containing protein [Bacillota bacterium]